MTFLTEFNNSREVTLRQMLDVRELRAMRQESLLERYNKPVLCFTMNIAGPVKNNDLIRAGFTIGLSKIKGQLERNHLKLLFSAVLSEDTGNEAFFVVDTDPFFLKELMIEIEEESELGRLFDMDVLYLNDSMQHDMDFGKIDREEIGFKGRNCMICDRPARECSSRRIHSVALLQEKTIEILYNVLLAENAKRIAEYAQRALLYEVSVTPKPGLVDRNNSGSHKDMDFYSFLNSASSLWPYFYDCAKIGQESLGEPIQKVLSLLRLPGKFAENRMLSVTDGVNTHKGAIFAMGILAACAGRLYADPKNLGIHLYDNQERLFSLVSAMMEGITKRELSLVREGDKTLTAGERYYLSYGVSGIRGELEAGLPAVKNHGLPMLKKLLSEGKDFDEAGAFTLLSLIAHTDDTNMIHRGGRERQLLEKVHLKGMLSSLDTLAPDRLFMLDQDYMEKNLSPGGSADLLAVCFFLYFLMEDARSMEALWKTI